MLRRAHALVWSRGLLLWALPGCVVSFNDYPLGETRELAAGAGRAGAAGSVGTETGGSSNGEPGGSNMVLFGSNPLAIDDFEDSDADILAQQGRVGSWYVVNDGQGTQTPENGAALLPSALESPRGNSAQGAHTFGGPFDSWGALIGANFASSDGATSPYDLSSYQGLRFWARSGSTTGAKRVRFNVRTTATAQGNDCTRCNDHFGVEVPLTSQWVQLEVPLASLKQAGYGRPVLPSPDLTQALGVELLFPADVSFDLWLDDLELY